ncbi:glycosyltransferase [uncultured Pseudokineococcus sp.]|uniref:glycosyltransferase n=1 Tax=uncultured Pseudokineococcus sp. TaxID=1642928 RepID=UPI00260F527F|nr:glycosyltransferase [uncultured Pseudokineococcus sp.]
MRVALVSEVWAPEVDGLVTRLESTVAELRRAGHEVLVVAPTTGTAVPGVLERRTRGVSVPFLYGGRRWALPDGVVARAVRAFAPDVVHVVNPVLMGVAAARWAASRHPLVVSYHTDVATYAGHYHLGAFEGFVHASMRWTYRRADVRLATSPVGRGHLAEIGIHDVDLWERGVDTAAFRPDRDGTRLRGRLGPDPDLPVALHVGRVASEKGCDRLVPLAREDPPVQLALVGEGPDRARLERTLAGRRAVFTGVLRGDDLADAYAAADALVFASETDTLGLVLLEAMACGLPVVALDTSTARQTTAGYAAVRLVPPGADGAAWNRAVRDVAAGSAAAAAAHGGGTAGLAAARAAVARPAGDWASTTERLVEDVYARAVRAAAARGVGSRRAAGPDGDRRPAGAR